MYRWNMCCRLSSESDSTFCKHLPSGDRSTTSPAVSTKLPGYTAYCHHTTSLRRNMCYQLSSELDNILCRTCPVGTANPPPPMVSSKSSGYITTLKNNQPVLFQSIAVDIAKYFFPCTHYQDYVFFSFS